MITPNSIIGTRYRVVKPLGGGGMKMVYLAEDLRLSSRRCALAEMVDSFTSPATQQQAVGNFQREADMLAQLSNEHIPRIFDRFSEENRHYLVMEYVDGVTLEQRLRTSGGKLAESEVVEVALQICDTLHYLHGLQPPVVYRDLKPSNVMLTGPGQLKLIDFGIARHFHPQSNATMIGTQGYAPPEQYRGKVEVRSDIYALGATMHHALSGRDPALEAPFSFPPLRSACPGVNPLLADLVDQALKYDVVLRVADATEFKTRLLGIKAGGVGAAEPISRPRLSPGRGQLGLPLRKPALADAPAASAPTVLTPTLSDIECPRCGRQVPMDSRFCSFCSAKLAFVLRPESTVHEAQTVTISDFPDRIAIPAQGPESRRRRRGRGFNLLLFVGLFAGASVLTTLVAHVAQQQPETPEVRINPMPPEDSGPDAVALQSLRRELDADGYKNVSFRLDRDTLIVWGTVSSEIDRANVRWIAFRVAGIVSVVDHIQVRDEFARP